MPRTFFTRRYSGFLPAGSGGGGGGGGGSPAFGAEMGTFGDSGSETTDTLTCSTNGCTTTAGNRIIVIIGARVDALTLSSVTDSAGNTYTIHDQSGASNAASGQITRLYIASAPCTNALTTASTITANWGSATSHSLIMWAGFATGCNVSQPDGSVVVNPSGSQTSAPTVTGTPVSTNTLAFAADIEVFLDTISGVAAGWTAVASSPLDQSCRTWIYWQTFSSVSAKTWNSTMSDTNWHLTDMIFFK